MGTKVRLITILIFTFLFTLLFYKRTIGLNLLFFETAYFAILLTYKKINFKSPIVWLVFTGAGLTMLSVIYNYSAIAIIINVFSMLMLTAVIMKPDVRSLFSATGLAISNIFLAFPGIVHEVNSLKRGGMKLDRILKIAGILVLPLMVIGFFLLIYRFANPVFEGIILEATAWIDDLATWIFNHLNMLLVFTIILGFAISTILFIQRKQGRIDSWDKESSDQITRKRIKRRAFVGMTALKNERMAGIFLLFVLNLLILIINVIDINWVWFSFEWEGQYLKQFVHEGTYLLIISILLSIMIVLYYFRGNLNFLQTNKLLKILSYIWLAQNAILTLSVAIRNIHYISHFGLAYKRIGVMFFLLLVLYGIFTVYIKVKNKKSAYYLFKKNSLAIYIVLVVMALFNWDAIIAKYNFSHYKTAFIHYDFMAGLSDKTLPLLDKSMGELEMMEPLQDDKFKFRSGYMEATDYYEHIQWRKQNFITEWESKQWLEWNYAEWKAYMSIADR